MALVILKHWNGSDIEELRTIFWSRTTCHHWGPLIRKSCKTSLEHHWIIWWVCKTTLFVRQNLFFSFDVEISSLVITRTFFSQNKFTDGHVYSRALADLVYTQSTGRCSAHNWTGDRDTGVIYYSSLCCDRNSGYLYLHCVLTLLQHQR